MQKPPAVVIPFHATPSAAERRFYRGLIKKAESLTRAERDILIAIVNIWFANRAERNVIRPGRSKLAKMVRCSIRTVSRALSEFQRRGYITATAYAEGGAYVTRYRVNTSAILDSLGKMPETADGNLVKVALASQEKREQNQSVAGINTNELEDYNPGQNGPRLYTSFYTSSTVREMNENYLTDTSSETSQQGPSQEEPIRKAKPPPESNVVRLADIRLNSWLRSFSMSDAPRTLRPHQQAAIDMLRDSLRSGNRRVVLQAPTGFGKTITATKIIDAALAKGNRVLFTVPRLSLVNQAIVDFERDGIQHIGAMQANHPRTDDKAPVQVATVQTLNHRLRKGSLDENFGLVIVDECHEDYTVIREMMSRWPDRVFVGLSATPWAKGLGKHWQDLRIAATIGSLIADGYLSKFVAYAPDNPDLSEVRTKAGEYVEGDLERVMAEGKIVGHVVETWLERGENRPTLVFGVNCAHAKKLYEQFLRAGVSAAYCDAYTDSVERELIKQKFISGEVKVACSVRTLTTGVDWPVSCIVDAAPTRSEMLHVQRVGRGLRINPGTEDLVILDHAGNSLRLGLVTDIHHDELDAGEKRAPTERHKAKLPKECVKCGSLHTGLRCPSCGNERKRICDVETVEGRLVQISGQRLEPTRDDRQRFWSMALSLDDYRQRGGKLALGLYKGKFGVWPRGLSDARIPFDAAFQRYEQSRRIAYAKKMERQRSAAG